MPSPTTSWNLVRVYATWRNMDGTLKAGTYRVTLPVRVTNATDDAIIPAGLFATGPLQTANGAAPSLDVQVPSNDDPDIEQTGWKVTIAVNFADGATAETYVIDVPYAARPVVDGGSGLGVNLRTVALTSSLPQENALYKVGVAGGLAKLNSSGQVIDASGTPVVGGGGSSSGFVLLDEGEEVPDPPAAGVLYLRLTGTSSGGDTTAPGVPTGLSSSAIGSTGFTVSWSASTDAVGVLNYDVRIGTGTPVVKTTLSHTFTGLTPSTAHSVTVRARDAAGNVSGWSTPLVVNTGAAVTGVSVFGASAFPGTVNGFSDGPAAMAMGFYTTLVGGVDVIGARFWLPSGLGASFYNTNVNVRSYLRNHTIGQAVSAANVTTDSVAQLGISQPLTAGWNEVAFGAPIHLNRYADGTSNAIWIVCQYASGSNYVISTGLSGTDNYQSAAKPGLFLAESSFPRGANSIGGSGSVIGTSGYPIDLLVTP